MKTEAEIKSLFGNWQENVAKIPSLPPSVLIGCLANAEQLLAMTGLTTMMLDPAIQQGLTQPEQEIFIAHFHQVMEFTLQQVRDEIDKRFAKVDTSK